MDPTRRFSNRVEQYIRYRPGYPQEVAELLEQECGLAEDATIADIGSGTGLLTYTLLQHGWQVIGVEPNREMREAGEEFLAAYPRFRSVDGRAEATGLPDASVDLIAAGQAFHWFDQAAARAEFQRILRGDAWVALVWNIRDVEGSPLQAEYEQVLRRYCSEYDHVSARHLGDEQIGAFFAEGKWRKHEFANQQLLDFEGLVGRMLSSSYAPLPGDPNYEPLNAALRELFDRYAQDDFVEFAYKTYVYLGKLV
jgi:SAM-dependent methyltransferase